MCGRSGSAPPRAVSGDGPLVLLEPLELELDEPACLCSVGRSGSDAGALLEAVVPPEDCVLSDCVLLDEEDDEFESDESARRRSVGRSGSEELWLPEEEELFVEDESEEDEPEELELLFGLEPLKCGFPSESVTS
jgi:hypothetical protein